MKLLKIFQKTDKGKTTAKVEFDDKYIVVCSSNYAEDGNDKRLKSHTKWFLWHFGKALIEEYEEMQFQNSKLPWNKRKQISAWNFMWNCDTMHPMRDKFHPNTIK